MRTGVYRKVVGRTGVGHLYEFDCLCRHHTTGEQFVVYIPLRVEPEWAGTVRHCVLERALFDVKFIWVGEGLPVPVERSGPPSAADASDPHAPHTGKPTTGGA